jgi:hypothetical protein
MQIPNNVAREEYIDKLIELFELRGDARTELMKNVICWKENLDIIPLIESVSKHLLPTTSPKVRKGDRSAIEGEDVFAQGM